ncbi:MAG: hypothetical protein C0475_05215 [Planctomyces sp.]|nr:hypothetical protein [Planctomyces sp.]MBA4038830.1 hypothetical protein [Planctomyces sp.]MBA4120764.1 hypothetical protein [Isosphaera sp.]
MNAHRGTRPIAARPAPVIAGAVALFLGGCTRPLLAPTDQRSPFDRYDAIRGQFAPQALENEFGARVPNVRERLRYKE